jgi:hypothetical protein
MSNYNLHNYLPYWVGQVVFVLSGTTITQGTCAAYHVVGDSYTYDVQFPNTTGTTNYPQSQVFNTYGNAQIAIQLATTPTPTLSPTNSPTPTGTSQVTPTPSMTPSYTGPQVGSNLFGTLTAAGGTVTGSSGTYVFTSTGGNPASLSSTISGIVDYKVYQLSIRYTQQTGKNATISLTSTGTIIQKLTQGASYLPADNVFQNNSGVLSAQLDGSGLLQTTFQVTAGTSLAFEAKFFDDSNFKIPMADGKTYGLVLSLLEVLPDVSLTPTPSVTPSVTPTISVTPSITVSTSITPSITPSRSLTPSPTAEASPTPSPSVTASVTVTPTLSSTPTFTLTPTPTVTPNISASFTPTPTETPLVTITASPTPSPTPSITHSPA